MTLFELVEQGNEDAVRNGNWCEELLNLRDSEGYTALMRAAIKGNYKVVSALCDCGADTQLKCPDGRKAVDLAALHGRCTVIIYLIKGGCGA